MFDIPRSLPHIFNLCGSDWPSEGKPFYGRYVSVFAVTLTLCLRGQTKNRYQNESASAAGKNVSEGGAKV